MATNLELAMRTYTNHGEIKVYRLEPQRFLAKWKGKLWCEFKASETPERILDGALDAIREKEEARAAARQRANQRLAK